MKLKKRSFVLASLAVACSSLAADKSGESPVSVKIRDKLAAVYPSLPRATSIKPAQVQGLYEVLIGGQIKYVDESAQYLFDGSLISLASKANLTSERLAELSRIDWNKLPHNLAFTSMVNGTGKRKVFVFADPNCGYCKKLERSLTELKDITVYTVLWPILGPDSVARSAAIACAPNPAVAWNAWMLDRVEPPAAPATCRPQFDRVSEFAASNGIRATPAIFLMDSTKLPGAVDTPDLERLIAAAQPK